MKAPVPLSQADDTVVLPRAVRAAAQRTEALVAQHYPAPEIADPNAPPAPVPEPLAAPVAPVPVEAPAPAPADPPVGSQDYEHMYKSLKGRFDRQAIQIADMQATMQNLASRSTPAPAPAPTAPTPKPARARQITEQEEAEYGAEFLGVVGKRVRDELGADLDELREQLQNIGRTVQGVTQVTTQTAREKLFAALDTGLPSWRVVNTNEAFLQWLALPDTLSGVTRKELLMRAFERNEADRLLAFFNGFLSEEAATAPQAPQPAPAPGITSEGKVPLETFAAPGRAKTPAAPEPLVPGEKPIISPAQITQFYVDVTHGKYRGKDDEKSRLEAMIFEAQAEGRVR